MYKESPSVQYFPTQYSKSANASYSRTYLTRTAFNGSSLHPRLRRPSAVAQRDVGLNHSVLKANMDAEDEAQIFAMPESSGDEKQSDTQDRDTSHRSANTSSGKKRKRSAAFEEPESRGSGELKGKRNSRKDVSKRVESTVDEPNKNPTDVVPDFDWFTSSQSGLTQGSQGKKKANYGKNNSIKSTTKSGSKNGKASLVLPTLSDEDLATPRKSRKQKFVNVQALQPTPRKSPRRGKRRINVPDEQPQMVQSVAKFMMPDDLGLGVDSSTTSISAELPSIFSPEMIQRRKRSSSSSSSSALSDVDSIVSLQLSTEHKRQLKAGSQPLPALPPNHIRCPVCASLVNLDEVPLKTVVDKREHPDLSVKKMPLNQQQDFCHRHHVYNAKIEWKSRGYPSNESDLWTKLDTKISTHIPQLRKILYRKESSHYLDKLDNQIKASKGNKSKIKRYLTESIIDVVRQGYYGPKGAKMMGHAITEHLSKALKTQQKSDRTLREVGVSAFISAVLLPELTVLIVMDDLDLDNAEEARKVLDESTAVGMILCPDDDHVDREDDE